MEEKRRHFQQPMKDSPIDKSVTHLKNNAIRAKDSASHQQNNCAQPTTRIARAHQSQSRMETGSETNCPRCTTTED